MHVGTERPTLKDLYTHVKCKISDKWYDIGVALLDHGDVSDLDIIKENLHGKVEECAAEMLNLWLARKPTASWGELLEALRKPNIKLNTLAAKIDDMLS